MPRRNAQRKHGTARGSPRRTSAARWRMQVGPSRDNFLGDIPSERRYDESYEARRTVVPLSSDDSSGAGHVCPASPRRRARFCGARSVAPRSVRGCVGPVDRCRTRGWRSCVPAFSKESLVERELDQLSLMRRSAGHVHGDRKIMAVCDCHDFAAFTVAPASNAPSEGCLHGSGIPEAVNVRSTRSPTRTHQK